MRPIFDQYKMNMRISQTLLAIVVALSVAMLPAAGGFAAGSHTMEVSAPEAMPDCGHHHHAPIDKTQKSTNDCASMAGCALKCFNFTGITFAGIAFSSPAGAALDPIRASDDIPPRMDGLPFRPPRV
jgi:hypothetical protein